MQLRKFTLLYSNLFVFSSSLSSPHKSILTESTVIAETLPSSPLRLRRGSPVDLMSSIFLANISSQCQLDCFIQCMQAVVFVFLVNGKCNNQWLQSINKVDSLVQCRYHFHRTRPPIINIDNFTEFNIDFRGFIKMTVCKCTISTALFSYFSCEYIISELFQK